MPFAEIFAAHDGDFGDAVIDGAGTEWIVRRLQAQAVFIQDARSFGLRLGGIGIGAVPIEMFPGDRD